MGVTLPNPTQPNPREITNTLRQLAEGRSNVSGTVTLTENVTTTTVNQSAIGKNAAILLNPRSANAAGALATTYVSAQDSGTFTLTHANAATTDRTFRWVAQGG